MSYALLLDLECEYSYSRLVFSFVLDMAKNIIDVITRRIPKNIIPIEVIDIRGLS